MPRRPGVFIGVDGVKRRIIARTRVIAPEPKQAPRSRTPAEEAALKRLDPRADIPMEIFIRAEIASPEHQRKLNRKARRGSWSTNGKVRADEAWEGELLRIAQAGFKHRDAQAGKASKPRGRGDDDRTTREIIRGGARAFAPDAPPRELWPTVQDKLEAAGKPAITYRHFCAVLREVRKKKSD